MASGPQEVRPTGPVLGVFAHPDDAEICAGGLLATWSAAGREVRAETLLSCDPTATFFDLPAAPPDPPRTVYNHSDHRTAGWIALDSVFPGSGNPHFFSEHLGEGLEVQEVHDVWLGWSNEPNHIEDVTATFDAKVSALGKHESQLAEGIRFFEEWMRSEAKTAGAEAGVELAEEFRVLDLS